MDASDESIHLCVSLSWVWGASALMIMARNCAPSEGNYYL